MMNMMEDVNLANMMIMDSRGVNEDMGGLYSGGRVVQASDCGCVVCFGRMRSKSFIQNGLREK